MEKISYRDLKEMLMNPEVPDSSIAPYLMASPQKSGPFDPRVVPNPDRVEMSPEGRFDIESTMKWGNAVARTRRHLAFNRAISEGIHKPVLVSEGDSWFQFPFLISDIVDHLNIPYLIWSLDAAGDTADNMVNAHPEYMQGLREQKKNNVKGFLFSGAGNDFIGEDKDGRPAIANLLKPFTPGKDAAWHIAMDPFNKLLERVEKSYRKLISTVRSDPDFKRLPIFFHGYDYAVPGGFEGDKRRPSWAEKDEWLGGPMKNKGIVDLALQREIVRIVIDHLHGMLGRVAGHSAQTRVFIVDVRETLKIGRNEWADEIHATSGGFGKVAKKFEAAIENAI